MNLKDIMTLYFDNTLKTRLKLSSFVLVEGEDFRRTQRFVIVGGNTNWQNS